MSLPSFQQLMVPTLAVLAKHVNGMHVAQIEDEIAALLSSPATILRACCRAGTQSVFANRLNWARSYLSKALLVETPRRGLCRVTERGRELLISEGQGNRPWRARSVSRIRGLARAAKGRTGRRGRPARRA